MKRIHIVSSVACAFGRVLLIAQLGAVVSTCLGQAPGSLDLSFDPTAGGTRIGLAAEQGGVLCLELQADGKLLLGGGFAGYNGTPRRNLARINTDG